MLRQVAEGVLIHESEFCQSNAIVVQGRAGVLLSTPGCTATRWPASRTTCPMSGQTVVAGFSTHPHWDHLLWHAGLGAAPRYGTASCAATVRDRLSARVRGPRREAYGRHRRAGTLDLLGLITGLPAGTERIPGTALKSGSSSIKRMPRAMRRC